MYYGRAVSQDSQAWGQQIRRYDNTCQEILHILLPDIEFEDKLGMLKGNRNLLCQVLDTMGILTRKVVDILEVLIEEDDLLRFKLDLEASKNPLLRKYLKNRKTSNQ